MSTTPDSQPVPPNAPGNPSIPAPTIVLVKLMTPLAIEDPPDLFDDAVVPEGIKMLPYIVSDTSLDNYVYVDGDRLLCYIVIVICLPAHARRYISSC